MKNYKLFLVTAVVSMAFSADNMSASVPTITDDEPHIWRYGGCDNGHFGFIDRNNDLVSPCIWKDAAYVDNEGLAAVKNDNGKWGFIDVTGKLVIPCTWSWAAEFSEGLCGVYNDKHLLGFIDKTGKLVIKCEFNGATGGFKNGKCRVKIGNWWYDINRQGKVIE